MSFRGRSQQTLDGGRGHHGASHQVFYSSSGAPTTSEPLPDLTVTLPRDTQFHLAFRHFLLSFTLNGESVYKNKIRHLGLDPATRPSQATRSMPSLCIDLEHLMMTHWVDEALEGAEYHENSALSDSFLDDDMLSRKRTWGDMLVLALRQQPLHFLSVVQQCIREVYLEISGINIRSGSAMAVAERCRPLALFQVEIISRQRACSIGELGASDVETLVTVPGIVVQAYRPQHKAVKVKLRCRQCEHEQWLHLPFWQQSVEFPRVCASGGSAVGSSGETRCPLDPYLVISDESEFCDVQTIKIQELPEHVSAGEMPRHISLYAVNVLCSRVAPGNRIMVAGVYSVQHKTGRQGTADTTVQSSYIYTLGISRLDGPTRCLGRVMLTGDSQWSFQQEEEFQRMAGDPTIHDQIFRSIAPSLFGLEEIKKSIACLLFGGSRKILADGTRLRGDINVLLLGDPSTAKSQFLKFVESVAPIAVYTSGKGSSAAGLTAAVIRDANHNFALEGGAMVLADGGVVCIDEFDKMRDDDRVAIHEAMEQQTISIAKAGITTVLTTRCALLAAANPSFGSYNDLKETAEQHNFETTILSRFDHIWLIRDMKSVERDQKVARHVIELHSGAVRTVQVDGPIPPGKLRNYIAYCRAKCTPHLSEEAAKLIENFYVEVRESIRQTSKHSKRDEIPITIRQLESFCRTAESLAKMCLSRTVTTEHVEQAIQLFKLSTLEAAKGGLVGEHMTESDKERVRAAEALILQRVPIRGKASKSSILRDLKTRGYDASYTGRALNLLIQKGIFEERGDASVKRVGLGTNCF